MSCDHASAEERFRCPYAQRVDSSLGFAKRGPEAWKRVGRRPGLRGQ
jgi:hypothetical protein